MFRKARLHFVICVVSFASLTYSKKLSNFLYTCNKLVSFHNFNNVVFLKSFSSLSRIEGIPLYV